MTQYLRNSFPTLALSLELFLLHLSEGWPEMCNSWNSWRRPAAWRRQETVRLVLQLLFLQPVHPHKCTFVWQVDTSTSHMVTLWQLWRVEQKNLSKFRKYKHLEWHISVHYICIHAASEFKSKLRCSPFDALKSSWITLSAETGSNQSTCLSFSHVYWRKDGPLTDSSGTRPLSTPCTKFMITESLTHLRTNLWLLWHLSYKNK